jgi:hexosaminidase
VPLASGVNEAYDLSVGADGQCSISADTVWGAFHGMESLAQLAAENCTISNTPVRIRDTPRFGFRGLMIDTARHYMPVKFIEHIIEGMAANRLNVLHWHIVDSSSFPYCSAMFPGLCEKGAYSPRATFTADQLKSLVDFAEARGVRIMPDVVMPVPVDWELGEPEIMVLDGPCDYTMDPTQDATYTFLAKFLKEVTTIFPDEYLFLGTPGLPQRSTAVQSYQLLASYVCNRTRAPRVSSLQPSP